jgi:hypothetical protein
LGTEPTGVSAERDWPQNYFNYFTEIEEHFQKARATSLFLLSPLDWALIESWKNSGIPLEAVLRGIDAAFEKWRSRKSKVRLVNSLAYCAQEVLAQAQSMAGTATPRPQTPAPFSLEELRDYLARNAAAVRPFSSEIAAALDRLAAAVEHHHADLEQLEQRLTILEEKLIAASRMLQNEEELLCARRDLTRQLGPYRSKMSGEQIAMLEKQYLERDLLEKAGLPRLSLFYMR